jgi:hypothetical protein
MIYQSMSGDAEGKKGTFVMTGGSLSYASSSGPLFYVTNSTGIITLKGVNVTLESGILASAAAGKWGNAGANGGTAKLTADAQALSGAIVADKYSSVSLVLKNSSSFSGAINAEQTAREAELILDASSVWNVTGDSYLTILGDRDGISGGAVTNITGNGHVVYYDKNANADLGGKTYALNGGGYLKPAS